VTGTIGKIKILSFIWTDGILVLNKFCRQNLKNGKSLIFQNTLDLRFKQREIILRPFKTNIVRQIL